MKLGRLLKIYMFVEEKSIRDLAKELDISPAATYRIMKGNKIDQDTFVKLFNWLFKECK